MKSKRKNFLTILLIIIIVIIVGVIGYLGYELITSKIKENNSKEIADKFDSMVPTITEDELEELQGEQGENNTPENPNQETPSGEGGGTENNNNPGNPSGGNGWSGNSYYTGYYNIYRRGVYVNTYWVVGTIRIPATGIYYGIFAEPDKDALDRGTGIIFTENGLNRPGTTVIAGHNYRNRLFFSQNKNLSIGNMIYIKDATGVEKAYTITKKFETTDGDTSFYQRNTKGKAEIALSTCTDNGATTGRRLIIIAREQ